MPTTAENSKPSARPRASRAIIERNAKKPDSPTQGLISHDIDSLYLQEALELVKELGKDVERVDPRVIMLRLVQDTFLMVQALYALVRGLEIKHIEGIGKYTTVQLPSGESISVPDSHGQIARVRLALLGEWLDRSTRVASLAVRAGLEERLVDLAEAQAKHMATLLQRFVRNLSLQLQLDASQQDLAMQLIVDEVRLLGSTNVTPVEAAQL